MENELLSYVALTRRKACAFCDRVDEDTRKIIEEARSGAVKPSFDSIVAFLREKRGVIISSDAARKHFTKGAH